MKVITEVETKFDVPAESALPRLDGLPHVAGTRTSTVELRATYYDTAQLHLLRSGITLRRRTGGADEGWHLKLPDDGSRHEVRVALGDPLDPPPPVLTDLLVVIVEGMPLTAVATIDTDRVMVELVGAGGRTLCEIADDRVTGHRLLEPQRWDTWREWELELGDDPQGSAEAAARKLLDAGELPSTRATKLGSVLAPTTPHSSPTPEPADSAAAVLAPFLAARVADMRHNDPLVRAHIGNSVHDMRVAARRLRTVLTVFHQLFDSSARDLRSELAWVDDVLGRPRDLEVMEDRIDALPLVGSAAGCLLAAEHADAHKGAVAALSSSRYLQLFSRLNAFAEAPPWSTKAAEPARPRLAKCLRKELHRLDDRIAALEHATSRTGHAELLHDIRRQAKRIRYATEAVTPAFGSRAVQYAQLLTNVQDVLGTHHDTVVAARKVRGLALADTTEALAALDVAAERDEARFRALLPDITARKYRHWLLAS